MLFEGLEIYLTAFRELTYDRPIGMSLGPIPWTSVDRWATRNNIPDGEEFNILLSHIRSLEEALEEYQKAQGSTA